jgi:hypothetical protein
VAVEGAADVVQQLDQVGVGQVEAREQHRAREGGAQEVLVAAVVRGEGLAVLAGQHQRGGLGGAAAQVHDERVLALPGAVEALGVGTEDARLVSALGRRGLGRVADAGGHEARQAQAEERGEPRVRVAPAARIGGQRGAVAVAQRGLELRARGQRRVAMTRPGDDGQLAGPRGGAEGLEDARVDPAGLAHEGDILGRRAIVDGSVRREAKGRPSYPLPRAGVNEPVAPATRAVHAVGPTAPPSHGGDRWPSPTSTPRA